MSSEVSPTPRRTAGVDIEVRYAETDQMGVVHHANYIVWFELARTRLCGQGGTHYSEIEDLGYLLVVTGTECRYLRGARYGDTVTVTARIDKLASRGIRFAYDVRRIARNGRRVETEHLADGATDHVWVDRQTRRPVRMPEVLREPFRAMAGQ
ncbi:MAG: acyl-CoA thioesterase [Thermoanaerobaculia bacterium]|nr:acyl-CoA thioesterase [Thermoanaerobaculia bacterium]